MRETRSLLTKSMLIALVVSILITFQFKSVMAASNLAKSSGREKVEVLVKYKDVTKADSMRTSKKNKLKLNKMDLKKRYTKSKVDVLQIDNKDNIESVVNELKKDSNVEYVQPNFPITINALPNDPYYTKQWGLSSTTGQSIQGNTVRYDSNYSDSVQRGVDIDVQSAWDITQGSSSVVVGVLDTGIDINHEDLKNNITGGWNFVDGTSYVFNDANPSLDAHGTEMAGIIAAAANNSKGISGVAPNVKIMPLKFINGSTGYTSDAIAAIDYAMSMGVKIVNCSFTGGDNNAALKDAMANSGILFICSAGNTGADTGTTPVFPAGFGLPNVISVAAIDGNGVLSSFSTYGSSIDVAAPGVNIFTTTPGNGYDYVSGTSASASFVTGEAALILSQNPNITIAQLKARIVSNVMKSTSLAGKVASGGRIDVKAALTNTPPTATDQYTGAGWQTVTVPVQQQGADADTWYTSDQLAKVKQQLHFGESGVNPSTGNFSLTANDMTVSSPGFTIDISRTYNSEDGTTTVPMGRGWTFGFTGCAFGINNTSDMVVVTLPKGEVRRFVRNANDSYTASDSRDTFVKNADGTFTLTNTKQYSYGFNTSGYLTWMKDRNGNTVTINVDSTGKVQSVTDQAGRVYTVTYTNGLISQITDPAGRKATYNYTSGLLTSVIDPMGNKISYGYDAQNYMTIITDNSGKIIENLTYDHTTNKVSKAVDQNGDASVYTYDIVNRKTSINENNGARLWSYSYDTSYYITSVQNPEGREATISYFLDANGKNNYGEVKSQTDSYGNTTSHVRDNNGNITKATNPDGSVRNFLYDNKNNLTMQQDENGKNTFYIYDTNAINLIKKVQPLNGTDQYVQETSNDSNFAATIYAYYSASEASSLGYKANGLLKSVTDSNGNITTYTYDANGDVATVTDQAGNVTSNTYSNIGWKTSTTSPNKNTTTYTYNQNGLLEKTVLNNGETTRTVYDDMGRKVQEISPNQYVQTNDNISADTYSDNTVGTRYTYYDSGMVKTKTDAAGNCTTYTYDVYGNVLTETKPNGSVYTYTYDLMNRQTSVSYQNNTPAASVKLETDSYSVLSDGNTQKTVTNYLNATDKAVTVFTYDYAGRLISKQNPDNTVNSTKYNSNGTIQTTTDELGSTTYCNYDGLNRLSEKWTPFENSNGTTLYSYEKTTYDNAGNKITVAVGKDKIAYNQVPSSFVTTNYTYYKNGKVDTVTDSAGRKTEYFYDGDGNVAEQDTYTDASNKNVIQYTYNQIGKPLTKTVHVKEGDIAGNDPSSTQDTLLTTTYTYDKDGNLKTVQTPNNVVTTYTYDNLDRQISISQPEVDENGNSAAISNTTTYNWEGKPLTTVDAKNNTTTYAYNQRGLLVSVIDANSGVTTFYYDIAGRKIAEVSPKNYVSTINLNDITSLDTNNVARTSYVYDLMGRVTAKIDKFIDPATGNWATITEKAYQYDQKGNVIEEQDPLGVKGKYGTIYTYNLANKVVSVLDPVSQERGLLFTKQYTYDGLGRKTSETDANRVITNYTLDDAGNIIQQSVIKNSSATPEIVKSATYDLAGNTLSVTDGNLNTTAFQYNALGKVRVEIDPGDATVPQNTITNQYDVMGNLISSLNSMGKKIIYTYDNQGRQTSKTEEKSDGTQAIVTSVKYDKNGNKCFVTDGNGNITSNTYDALNRVVAKSITVSGVKETSTNTYDANGNKLTDTDWRGNTTTYKYDPINRLLEKEDAYNIAIEKLTYNDDSLQITSTDALGNVTQFAYDDNNRLTTTTDPAGNKTSKYYDNVGNISSKVDGNGNATTYAYDEFNRLVSVKDPLGEVTSYTYDLNGNMLTKTNGNGNITTFEYNVINKPVRKIDQGGRTGSSGSYVYNPAKMESYTYFVDGNIATMTDRNGNTSNYTYDIHGRLLSKAIGQNAITYVYDNNGNELTMTDNTGMTTRTYDELNRVITKTVPVIGKSVYVYDITNNQSAGYTAETTTDPKGHATTKAYDKDGRLYTVTADGATTTYSYYGNGSRQSVVYQGGSREDYTYTNNGLNKTLVNKKADGTVIDSYSYTYDAANNQVSKADSKGTTTYTYDSLNRLSTVTEPNNTVTTYTFDRAGNRLTQTITTGSAISVTIYDYNEQNRLQNATNINNGITQKTSYFYDNNGNVVSSGVAIVKPADSGVNVSVSIADQGQSNNNYISLYKYDVWNKLIGSSVGNNSATYGYNGDGLRTSKTVNGQTTNYLYEYDKVVLEEDGQGNETARNVYGTNLLSRTAAGQTAYYMYNGHGDVTALMSTTGSAIGTYYYDAFGNITESSGDANNPYTYAGYQYDKETGLYYCNARMYDPKIARFLQEDTFGGDSNDPLSLNRYTYCVNNPLVYYDPTGHWPDWVDRAVKYAETQAGKALNDTYNSMVSSWAATKEAVTSAWNSTTATISSAINYTTNTLGSAWNTTTDIWSSSWNSPSNWSSSWNSTKNTWSSSLTSIGNKWCSSASSATDTWSSSLTSIGNTWNSSLSNISDRWAKDLDYNLSSIKSDMKNWNLNIKLPLIPSFENVVKESIKSIDLSNEQPNRVNKLIDTILPGSYERSQKLFDSPHAFGNWATNGMLDMMNGAINPKEPLSLQHWMDSAVTASMMLPGVELISSEIGGLLEKSAIRRISQEAGNGLTPMNLQMFASKGVGNTGADNIATLPKLNAQLTYEEASSVFTKSGTLEPEVIKNSSPIISGSELGNQKVINALTSDGRSINDWAKMSTQTFKSPSGDFQVHFYENLKTGEISTYEMKVKFNMQGVKK